MTIKQPVTMWMIGVTSYCLSLYATAYTTDEAYQVVDNAMIELNMIALPTVPVSTKNALNLKAPHHVLQKSREVYANLQQLKQLKGLDSSPVPYFPTSSIQEADLEQVIDLIYMDIKVLQQAHKVESPKQYAPLPQGTTYTELFVRLDELNQRIVPLLQEEQAIYLYPAVISLISDLDAIRQARKIYDPVAIAAGSTNKQNYDVYYQLVKIHYHLHRFCVLNASLCSSGGINAMAVEGNQIPEDIISDAIYNLMAEVGVIKINMGLNKPTKEFAALQGRDMNKVFDAALTAQNLAATIR
ncbi:hypothetical protein [Motilimonas pumila]|uniref:Uncharacterized protein n=1 Tax=Motilimonas pumila TaxID=2303987 RepID=A0A418YIC4_9GAMM|nr:hypothetical protein [Motilimonas pumila]RJG50411.1 hypothetical protein D1Z90_02725 [Motilimonas pumila]